MLVEDNLETMKINCDALTYRGYTVIKADSLAQAEQAIAEYTPDLFVVDIMLPDGTGLELCEKIRKNTLAPILFLTALGDEEQIVTGFRAGGDDYITKPCGVNELVARIEAHLRRTTALTNANQGFISTLTVGNLLLDHSIQRAFVGGKDILLKPKEFLILFALVQSRGSYVSPKELYEMVWRTNALSDSRTVHVHISTLRSKLKNSSIRITFFSGLGYKIEED